MRKLLFFIAFAGLSIVVFHSCKKDKVESPGSEDNSISEIMTLEDIQTRDRILNFRDNVGNHLKSGETIEIDSAIWNLESSINYTYCGHDFNYKPLPLDSLFYEIPLTTDGQALESDVDSIYSQIISDLTVIFDNIEADTKHMVFSDIEEIGFNRSGTSTSIIVTTSFGINPLFIYGSFDEGDDWMFGNNLGMCDDPTIESDAAEEIEYKLNNPENPPVFEGTEYFTNPVPRYLANEDWPNPDDDVLDNWYDYLVFYNETDYYPENYHECLEYEEMNFYLAGAATVINTFYPLGLRPVGLTFMSINLESAKFTFGDFTFAMHMSMNKVMYGERHITTDPPGDL